MNTLHPNRWRWNDVATRNTTAVSHCDGQPGIEKQVISTDSVPWRDEATLTRPKTDVFDSIVTHVFNLLGTF
jgi:hypothetical protein